jgi:hypothetical protein
VSKLVEILLCGPQLWRSEAQGFERGCSVEEIQIVMTSIISSRKMSRIFEPSGSLISGFTFDPDHLQEGGAIRA